ncbi:MAG: hypothetical protein RIR73_2210 [Chloroflexota bacterium]
MATFWSPFFVILLWCRRNVICNSQAWAIFAASIARIEPDNILNAIIVIVHCELEAELNGTRQADLFENVLLKDELIPRRSVR